MQKMIKLLVLDIDETLIKPTAKTISGENREAIRRAMEAGVRVTLASGRLYPAMEKWVDALQITEPVIAANGADVRQDGKALFRDLMDEAVAEDILRRARDMDMMKYVFAGDCIYCTPDDHNAPLFEKWMCGDSGSPPVTMCGTVEEMLDTARGSVQKVLLWPRGEDQQLQMLDWLGRRWGDVCSMVRGESVNIEINRKGTSKAAAVRKIIQTEGISMSEVMAIGDSENDADLLREAGLGVAVANAMPHALAAADAVTGACEEHGVAQAVKRFLL